MVVNALRGVAKTSAVLILVAQSGRRGLLVKVGTLLQLRAVRKWLGHAEDETGTDDDVTTTTTKSGLFPLPLPWRRKEGTRGKDTAAARSGDGDTRESWALRSIERPLLLVSSPLRPFARQVVTLWITSLVMKRLFPIKYRLVEFWRLMLPIFMSYVLTKHSVRNISDRAERDAIWHEQHLWGGEKVFNLVVRLSGFYVKSAQILGSKSEFMPPEWTDKLSVLFDQHPAAAWREIQPAIQRELKASPFGRSAAAASPSSSPSSTTEALSADWNEALEDVRERRMSIVDAVFEDIDHDALAAASIAQVHTATLRHGPVKKVVLKVQKLGVEALIKSDLRNMKKVARFLRPYMPFDLTPIADESYVQIPLEFDFEREVDLMTKIRQSLVNGGFDTILVPRPIYELCSPRMIVMEFMEGVPFSQLLKADPKSEEAKLVPMVEDGFRRLLDAYGQMMLIDGVFHADPHPGNLLMRESGDIVLLDYGQTKELPAETIVFVSQMVDMLAEGDSETIVEAMDAAGMKMTDANSGEAADPEVVVKSAYIFFDTRYMEEASVNPFDPDEDFIKNTNVGFNAEMWMIVRFIVLLRGIFHQLKLDISAVDIWQPYARRALDKYLSKPELLGVSSSSVTATETDGGIDSNTHSPVTATVRGPPTSLQMVQLRRFAMWLRKYGFAHDRPTMQKLYLANVLSSVDIMARDEDEMVKILVDWERREISRLHRCASGKVKSSGRMRSFSPVDDTDRIEEEDDGTMGSKKNKKTRSWSSFWYGRKRK